MAGTAAFITSLAINLIIACVVLVIFAVLRRKFPKIYATRIHVFSENAPPSLPDSLFGWIKPLYTMPREQLIQYAGLDAYMFRSFILWGLKTFSAVGVLGMIVLWSTNSQGDVPDSTNANDDDAATASGIDNLSIANIEEESDKLWVHCFMTYAITILISYFLINVWKDYVAARHHFLSRSAVENHTVLAFGLPAEATESDAALFAWFNRIYPNRILAVSTIPDANDLDKLQDEHNKTVAKLEGAMVKQEATGETQQHKAGAKMGCIGGQKVDSLPTYTADIERMKDELATSRDKSFDLMPSGFVTFKGVFETTVAAQGRHTADADNTTVLAPEPRDVIWTNLSMGEKQKVVRRALIKAATYALVFFWTIPVAFASSLSNLKKISENDGFGWLEPLFENDAVTGLIEGYLPTIVLAVFMAILPMILAAFTKLEGVHSNALITSGVIQKFFLFQLFNVLLVSTISGAVFDSLSELTNNPAGAVDLLATSLPTVANYFGAYISLLFMGLAMQILRPGPLIVTLLKLKMLAKTERAIKDTWAACAGAMPWNFHAPTAMFVGMVAIVYAPMQPLVPLVAVLYFAVAVLVWTYNTVYVYRRPFESGGIMWPVMFHRMVLSLYLMCLTMIGLLGLKKAPGPAAVLVPNVAIIAIMSAYCVREFEEPGKTLPLEKARAVDDTKGGSGPVVAGEAGAPADVKSAYARPSFNPLYDFEVDKPAYDPDSENPLVAAEAGQAPPVEEAEEKA